MKERDELSDLIKICREDGISYDISDTPQSNLIDNMPDINIVEEEKIKSVDIKVKDMRVEDVTDIEELRSMVEEFDGCNIKDLAQNTVFSDGVFGSEVLIIGEAPGAMEDQKGIPFCGRSGVLLDKMLSSIDLSREENVYITNTVFWRPPNNRRPTDDEFELCRPFLEKHIALSKPKIILLLGASAVYSVLRSSASVSKIRGKFYKYTNKYFDYDIPTLISFHPAYLLRQATQKKFAWEDLKMLRNALNNGFVPKEELCEIEDIC